MSDQAPTKKSFLSRLFPGGNDKNVEDEILDGSLSGLSGYSTMVGTDGSVAPVDHSRPTPPSERDEYLQTKWHVSLTDHMVRHISGVEALVDLDEKGVIIARAVSSEFFDKLPATTQCKFLEEGAEAYQRVLDVRNPNWREVVASHLKSQQEK